MLRPAKNRSLTRLAANWIDRRQNVERVTQRDDVLGRLRRHECGFIQVCPSGVAAALERMTTMRSLHLDPPHGLGRSHVKVAPAVPFESRVRASTNLT